MTSDLETLLLFANGVLWSGFVVFLRIGAIVALLPAFGERSIPARVRLAIALAFVAIVLPGVSDGIPEVASGLAQTIAQLAPEIVTGLFFGLLVRFFVIGLQIAGSIAAQSTSLSQIFGGSAGVDPQPAIGQILFVAALTLVALLGLHVDFARYMIASYTLVPVSQILSPTLVADMGVAAVAHVFALAFSLSAPFVLSSLLYNITLGVINRAMPQLMVSFIGAPAITAGGLALLMLAMPLMLQVWLSGLSDLLADPAGALP